MTALARLAAVGLTPPTTFSYTASGTVTNFNIRSWLDGQGFKNFAPSTITITVPSGAKIVGSAGNRDALKSGTIASIHTVTIVVSGQVLGYGGPGGAGGVGQNTTGGAGGTGGDAIDLNCPATITINSSGKARGGGGGGGGQGGGGILKAGRGIPTTCEGSRTGAAGGRGQGSQGSAGTRGGAFGQSGSAGPWGVGCNRGNGGAGGAGGYAIRKNGNTVNVTNNGTTSGTIG